MIARAIMWVFIKPTPPYHYPDYFDPNAFAHALKEVYGPVRWRRWVPQWFRRWVAGGTS